MTPRFFAAHMFNNYRAQGQKGQAVLGVVILFTVIVTTVVLGITAPTWRQVLITRNEASSAQSYLGAESLAEDLAYRLKTGKTTATSQSLTVGGASVTATITSNLGNQDIKS